VRKILDSCFDETQQLLKKKLPKLHLLAKTLLEFETLSGDEIKALLDKGSAPAHDPISGNTRKKRMRSRIPATELA
jgi:cell division protease FtsH